MKFQYRYILFLSSSVFRFLFSFLTLPITTRILDADDYGVHALVTSITLLVLTFSGVGSALILSYRLPDAPDAERRELISTLLWFGMSLFIVGGVLLLWGWSALAPQFEMTAAIPIRYLWLSLLTTFFAVPWQIGAVVFILTKQAQHHTTVIIGETVIGAAAVIAGLYVWGLDTDALFIGGVIAGAFNITVTLFFLRGYLVPRISLHYIREAVGFIAPNMASDFAWRGGDMVQNIMLSQFVGLSQLGVYSHAYKYRSMVFMYAKAASSSIEPTTLEEAKTPPYEFKKTRLVWDTIFTSVILIALGFTFLGKDFISLLTNDKFTEAAVFIPFLLISTLFQFMARADNAVVLVNNEGRYILWSNAVSQAARLLILIISIPLVGIWGAVIADIVLQLILRGAIISKSRKLISQSTFRDPVVVWGACIIMLSWIINQYLAMTLIIKVAACFAACGFTLTIAYLRLRTYKSVIKEIPLFRFRKPSQ